MTHDLVIPAQIRLCKVYGQTDERTDIRTDAGKDNTP